jgi:hypothetical protein
MKINLIFVMFFMFYIMVHRKASAPVKGRAVLSPNKITFDTVTLSYLSQITSNNFTVCNHVYISYKLSKHLELIQFSEKSDYLSAFEVID